MPVCSDCGKTKDGDEFHWNGSYRRPNCKECANARRRIAREKNASAAEADRKSSREWRSRNRKRANRNTKMWKRANKIKVALITSRELAKKRGYVPCLTLESEIPEPVACAICGFDGQLCLDHDHTTGDFRGWLCHRCNRVIGMAKDSKSLLRRMADYV